MSKKAQILLPKVLKSLSVLGENIKLARLRRNYSAEQVSERAGISRPTLLSIEKGSAKVSMGAYVQVLSILGLEKDVLLIAKDDELGRKLQDAQLIINKRASKRE
jgi:transcriptional regulator with XRE-family HTH domain